LEKKRRKKETGRISKSKIVTQRVNLILSVQSTSFSHWVKEASEDWD